MQADILQLASSGNATELRGMLKLRALRSLYFFAKVVLGNKDLVDHLHLPWCQHIQGSQARRKRGYLLPRGHFKSTLMKAYALWRLLKFDPEEFPELDYIEIEQLKAWHNPDTRIVFVGESDTVGQKNLNEIKWHITSNALFRWLFPEFTFDPKESTKWRDDEIVLPFRTRAFDESSITTIGVGAKRTGFHWDLIIYDDIIGEKASLSLAEMLKAINWFKLACGMLNDQTLSEELIIGTRWKHGTADLYGWIMKEMPENMDAVQATEDGGAGRTFGFVWYIRSAIEDNEPIFPERFTLATLEAIRNRQKDYLFNCQYMNTPSSPEGAEFSGLLLGTYTIGEDNRTLIPTDGSSPVALRSLYRIGFLDPSSGGKGAACENAIVVTGEDSFGRIFVLAAWSKNCGYTAALEQYHLFNDKFIPFYTFYESVGAQKELEELEKERRQQTVCRHCLAAGRQNHTHRRLTLKGEKPPNQLKEERIRAYYGGRHDEGRVYLGPGMQKLRNQITEFPHGEMVDILDALAYCVHLSRKPMSMEQEAEDRQEQEAMQAARKPCTNTEVDYGGY